MKHIIILGMLLSALSIAIFTGKVETIDKPIGSRTANFQIGSNVQQATANSILFVDSGLQLAQDNTNFNWNDTTNLLTAANLQINTKASVSGNFEVSGNSYASASVGFFRNNLIAGASVASSSTEYVAEFGGSDTATTSILFGGNASAQGTCLQMKNTAGAWVYVRINAGETSFTISSVKCR